jgi:hypothetical protein
MCVYVCIYVVSNVTMSLSFFLSYVVHVFDPMIPIYMIPIYICNPVQSRAEPLLIVPR